MHQIRRLLPAASLCYVADNGYLPYGSKPPEVVRRRSPAIGRFLVDQGNRGGLQYRHGGGNRRIAAGVRPAGDRCGAGAEAPYQPESQWCGRGACHGGGEQLWVSGDVLPAVHQFGRLWRPGCAVRQLPDPVR
ncbi:hypothetical protein [Sedimenticola thiotaurini]|uniref:hypothetical protein n=1 Tax=Sedimenticola thiotaurini TaxID=1543721 RepID=UPI001F2BBD98|nr:hypothetical protein [Sedimenticola thiotaurini]